MTAYFQKNKAILGQDFEFIFQAPANLTANPTLKIVGQSGVLGNETLLPERASLSVSAIGTDRKTLTLTASTTPLKPLQKDAFLTTNSDSFYPVSITRIFNNLVLLAEPLPKEVEIGVGGVAGLVFAIYRKTLLTATYTSIAQTLAMTVNYSENLGDTPVVRSVKSSLKVCPRPFSTGLTHNLVLDSFPNLSEVMSRRQTDLNTFIIGGEADLLLLVRDALLSKDCTEDEIFNAEIFQQAHLYFTAARIYEVLGQFELAEKLRTRAIALTDSALKVVSLDLDGDGIVDQEEIVVPINGGKPTDFRGNFYGRTITEYESQFVPKRGMRF